MVAISLYIGNLHRVPPDTPRRWLMPSHKLSVKHFRTLLSRRVKAVNSVSLTTSSSNPNPNDAQDADDDRKEGITELVQKVKEEEEIKEEVRDCEKVNELKGGREVTVEEGIYAVQAKESEVVKADGEERATEKPELSSEKLKRMREVEEKLQVLNTKKHDLVQVLKLILNAEEEVKRRNSIQGLATRPPNPLQVDVSNDAGLMARHATPRAGSEANLVSEMEGIEADDASNQQMHSRHLLWTRCISPSSESAHIRLQPNMVSHPSQTNPGITVSPARFAPTGHQDQPAKPPSVSVSGTGYVASSPSPAASGGTLTAFRDGRLPSPWN